MAGHTATPFQWVTAILTFFMIGTHETQLKLRYSPRVQFCLEKILTVILFEFYTFIDSEKATKLMRLLNYHLPKKKKKKRSFDPYKKEDRRSEKTAKIPIFPIGNSVNFFLSSINLQCFLTELYLNNGAQEVGDKANREQELKTSNFYEEKEWIDKEGERAGCSLRS